MSRAMPFEALCEKLVYVDGYNVLITTDCLLSGHPVYLCDDGFLRDTRGFFKRSIGRSIAPEALAVVLDLLFEARPFCVEILFDQQISRSGELASEARMQLLKRHLSGSARCLKDVDHQLKICGGIVASSDGNVIDSAGAVVDLPAEIARRKGICTQII